MHFNHWWFLLVHIVTCNKVSCSKLPILVSDVFSIDILFGIYRSSIHIIMDNREFLIQFMTSSIFKRHTCFYRVVGQNWNLSSQQLKLGWVKFSYNVTNSEPILTRIRQIVIYVSLTTLTYVKQSVIWWWNYMLSLVRWSGDLRSSHSWRGPQAAGVVERRADLRAVRQRPRVPRAPRAGVGP